jgi:hypothetical protein
MSDIGLFAGARNDVLVWLAVTIALGGPAAIATGRAIARGWRPLGRAVLFMIPLAAAADFLCHALFQVSALPIIRVARQIAAGNIIDAGFMLTGYLATFIILMIFATLGWRATRARQMRAQYPFL